MESTVVSHITVWIRTFQYFSCMFFFWVDYMSSFVTSQAQALLHMKFEILQSLYGSWWKIPFRLLKFPTIKLIIRIIKIIEVIIKSCLSIDLLAPHSRQSGTGGRGEGLLPSMQLVVPIDFLVSLPDYDGSAGEIIPFCSQKILWPKILGVWT